MLKMQSVSRDLMGTGLSSEDREMIAGMAQFNAKTGEYFVNLKGATMSVAQIGKQHLKALKEQNQDLKDRALASQTFDEAWQNTIMEFKATLLPMVQGINEVLQWARPTITKFMNAFGDIMGEGKGMIVALGVALAGFKGVAALIKGVAGIISRKVAISKLWKGTSEDGKESLVSKVTGKSKGAVAKGAKHAGKGMLRGGAGIGAAALGVGAGVGAAAAGIGMLADSMSKLDDKQLETLQGITTSISILMGIGVGAAVAVAAFGGAATAAWPGLLAFGGAIALIGTGVGVAAAGIGYMASNMAKLTDDTKVKNLGLVGEGLTSIMAAVAGQGLGGTIKGLANLGALTTTMASMAVAGSQMQGIESTFASINAVMNGDISNLMKVKDTIKAISDMDMENGSAIASLTKLLSQPIKVEFADESVAINVDTTLELDGDVLYRKVISKYSNIRKQNNAREGKDTVKV
jgi:hypothetical protein